MGFVGEVSAFSCGEASTLRPQPVGSTSLVACCRAVARRLSTRCGGWTGERSVAALPLVLVCIAAAPAPAVNTIERWVMLGGRSAAVAAQPTSLTLLRRARARHQLAQQVVNLGMILASALIIWKSLILFTASESPVVVVLRCVRATRRSPSGVQLGRLPQLARRQQHTESTPRRSGSMEPAFQRGDILFLNNWVRPRVLCALQTPACVLRLCGVLNERVRLPRPSTLALN